MPKIKRKYDELYPEESEKPLGITSFVDEPKKVKKKRTPKDDIRDMLNGTINLINRNAAQNKRAAIDKLNKIIELLDEL